MSTSPAIWRRASRSSSGFRRSSERRNLPTLRAGRATGLCRRSAERRRCRRCARAGHAILPLVHGSARTEVRLAMRRGNLGHPASARCLWGERGFRAIELLFPLFEHGAGLEPMRWNSVKKTAQWAVFRNSPEGFSLRGRGARSASMSPLCPLQSLLRRSHERRFFV